MNARSRRATSALVLGLACAAFTAGAHANPGNGNGNGPAVTPPGQEKKAEVQQQAPATQPRPAAAAKPATPPGQAKKSQPARQPARPAAPGQAQKAQKAQKAPARAQAARPQSGSFKPTSQGTDRKNGHDHKHTICHATGSASNPYVMITPSIAGVFNGHMGHQDGRDIVPPFTYRGQSYSLNWDAAGQAIFANGCRVPQQQAPQQAPQRQEQQQQQQQQSCPPAAATEQVLLGVWHKTGAIVDGRPKFVFITPDEASAHLDKHEDDVPVYGSAVVQLAGAEACEERRTAASVVVQQQPPAPTDTSASLFAPPAAPAAGAGAEQQEAAGGVLGVQATLPTAERQAQPAGGVLGTVGRVAGTQLPFTGLPLWIAALVGTGLLAAGFAIRSATVEH